MNKSYDEAERVAKVEGQLSSEVQAEFAGSTMSKAGRLAMELNAERKRLKERSKLEQIKLPSKPHRSIRKW